MIFPAGRRKNIDTEFNPLRNDPRSAYYEPELKKNVRKAQRESDNGITDPRSLDYQPEMRGGRRRAHEWAVRPQDQHMDDVKQGVLNKACTITSARAGKLSDIGGPVRQMHTATNNSIWNPNVLAEIRQRETEGEALHEKNAKAAEDRKQLRMSDRNLHIDKDAFLASYAQSLVKGNSVVSNHAHASDASNYGKRVASHNLSIFDYMNVDSKGEMTKAAEAADFARLEERTAGEQIAQSARERRGKSRKDRSWATASTPMSSKAKLNAMFSGIRKQEGK